MVKLLFTMVFAGAYIAAVAQTPPLTCSFSVISSAGEAVAISATGMGTPYTLTATIKTEDKLADGNVISGFNMSRQARDSSGRTLVDAPMMCHLSRDHQPERFANIIVTDPAMQTVTSWSTPSKGSANVAIVQHLHIVTPSHASNPRAALLLEKNLAQQKRPALKTDPSLPQIKYEYLGERSVAGLEASGMKTTRTTPAGNQGNAMPLVNVEEKWVSNDFGVILLDIVDSPLFGKATYEVMNFSREEPPAALFHPPADYTIEDKTPPAAAVQTK